MKRSLIIIILIFSIIGCKSHNPDNRLFYVDVENASCNHHVKSRIYVDSFKMHNANRVVVWVDSAKMFIIGDVININTAAR